jgi:hypothetical protein
MMRDLMQTAAFLLLISASALASSEASLQPQDLLETSKLNAELKAFCLKLPMSNAMATTKVLDATTRETGGMRLQSLRFEMSQPSINGSPNCQAERSVVAIVDVKNKKRMLYDSGFYLLPYCQDPVRYLQPPRAFTLSDLTARQGSQVRRKLVVLELVSSTLPCPDIMESRARRYFFYDIENAPKLLLEVEAEQVVPEIGDETYRIHLVNVTNVRQSLVKGAAGELPTAIDLRGQNFNILWAKATKDAGTPLAQAVDTGSRVQLNQIYSKDARGVYYETADGAGPIKGADPKSFELLSTTGESAYTKDRNGVYFFGERVPLADPKTFVLCQRHNLRIRLRLGPRNVVRL